MCLIGNRGRGPYLFLGSIKTNTDIANADMHPHQQLCRQEQLVPSGIESSYFSQIRIAYIIDRCMQGMSMDG